MFEAAGMRLREGSFDRLAAREVNGRQIRNLVRLARVMHPSGEVGLEEMGAVLEYGCR
jgi:hypothetical protein